MSLGERIKNFRKKKGLTIKDLSEKTNLSIGFISNLERDLSSPTIHNLENICDALGIDLIDILDSNNENEDIVHKDERKQIFSTEDNKITFESLLKGAKELNALSITIDGNNSYSHMCWGHNYDEIGVVIKGCLEVEVEGKTHILNEGDSIYITKFTPHKYKNPGEETNITYWFSPRN
ncbi:helix-turn-helix domain-containing protein [Clostridium fallax]|uniref:Transcriptional regulator, XRE family with cupin sensor n=1 Tax=Clostridium fallax TaxID=1533 RepID=A0A1M4XVB2_9CLOT|nr:XRE family transcriptional regulator [Clostridium fallax]SHE97286.1 transcriptional regulator, XRE family with cupin sensor [Clostridium fallax]SQB06523.1 DNA-binding protein [Clostridium fallax]